MSEEHPKPSSWLGRTLRTLFRFAGRLLLGALVVIVSIGILLQIPLVSSFVARTALRLANPWPRTETAIGSVGGSWFSSLSLTSVRIASSTDSLLVSIDTLQVSYDLTALFSNSIHFREVSLSRPIIRTRFLPDGTAFFLHPFAPDTANHDTSQGLRVHADRLRITGGELALLSLPDSGLQEVEVHDLHLNADSVLIAGGIAAIIDTLGSQVVPNGQPESEIQIQAAGALTWDHLRVRLLKIASARSRIEGKGDIPLPFSLMKFLSGAELTLSASPIAYKDLHLLLPEFGPEGEARLDLAIAGQGDSSSGNLTMLFPGGGTVSIQGTASSLPGESLALKITGASKRFSPSALTGSPKASELVDTRFSIAGEGRSLESFSGTLSVELSPSHIGGSGPLIGTLNAKVEEGSIHALLRTELRPVVVNAEADLRPFAPIPSYDVRGSISILRAARPDDPLERFGGLAARFSLSGIGLSAHEVRARAVVEGAWSGNPHFRSILVHATSDRDTIETRGRVVTEGGSLRLAAGVLLSERPEYKIHTVIFRGISLASFESGLPVSNLTGALRAEGRGATLGELNGKLSLTIDSSRIGDVTVGKLRTEITVDGGRFRFAGVGESDAGSISLQGSANPTALAPSLTLEKADLRGIDLGKILGSEELSSRLNGSVELHATARSMRDLSRLASGALKDSEGAVRASGNVRFEDSRLNQETIRAGSVTVSLLDANLETTLDIQTSKGGLKGNARISSVGRRPGIFVSALTLEHVDIGALAGNSLRTDLSGLIKGAFTGDSLESATGDLAFDFLNVTTSATLPLGGSLRANIQGGDFSVNSHANFRDGRADLQSAGRFIRGGVRGKVSLDVAFKDSVSSSGVAIAGARGFSVRSSVEGTWGLPAQTDLRGMLHGGGSLRTFTADTLLCDFSVHRRVLNLDTVKLLTNVATVTGGGTLALFDSSAGMRSDFSLSAIATSLQPLEGLLGLDPTVLHGASLSVLAVGPPEKTEVHCETSVDMAALGDLTLASLKGSADIRLGPSVVLASLDGKTDVGGFHYGPLNVANASVSVHSQRNKHDISGLIHLDRESTIKLAGSLQDDSDSLRVLIDTLVALGPAQTWSLERQASIVYGPRLVVRDLVLHSGSKDIMVEGILDPKGEQDFTVITDSLSVDNFGKLFGRPGLNGLMFTNIHVGGSAADPRAAGNISVTLSGGEKDLGRLSSRLDWKERSLEIDGGIQQPGGGKLDITARLPVALPLFRNTHEGASEMPGTHGADSLDVVLKADGFDLELLKPLLSPQELNALGGTLAANIRVTGTLGSIVADGAASIDGGWAGITQLGTAYSGIQLRCAARGKELQIQEAKATSGEGALQLSGMVNLQEPVKPSVDLKVVLQNFAAIQTPNIKANVSGDLLLTGGISTPTITGNLLINDSYYVLPDAGKLDSIEVVELTAEDYAMLQRYFGYNRPVTVEKEGPSIFDPTLDITVAMQKNTWFRKRRNPTLAIELQGTVHIERRTEQSLRLTGTLRCPAGRSYVGQFGRQFELTEGEIILKGPVEETELHINSEYKVPSKGGTGLSEVVIRMKVESKLGSFIFSLTSDPAMDESEILSYLATGQSRTGALANTGDQGGLAGAMALEQLVGVAGGLAEGSMPLDVFQIRQDGARGITVVAGNYVGPKTYLGIRQPILLNQGTEDTYYDTRTQYEMEYEARPWLFLNLQGGSSRTLLFLKARVAY